MTFFHSLCCYYFFLKQAPQLVVVLSQSFTSEGSGPLLVLPGLNCYSFPLTLVIGHSNITTHALSSTLFLPCFPLLWHEYSMLPSSVVLKWRPLIFRRFLPECFIWVATSVTWPAQERPSLSVASEKAGMVMLPDGNIPPFVTKTSFYTESFQFSLWSSMLAVWYSWMFSKDWDSLLIV